MPDVDFLPLKAVLQRVGLSKTEVYRKMAQGKFPMQRSYRDSPGRKFWLSTEVSAWQADQLGNDFDGLLS